MSRRTFLLTFLAGLTVGLALGLIYSWLIDPVRLYNTTPPLLRTDYRHEWIRLAALGYVADGDLERALLRLKGLPEKDVREALTAMIEAYAASGQPASTMRRLTALADRLGIRTPAMLAYLETTEVPPATVPPTPTPPPPLTPSPTIPPTETPAFVLPSPVPSLYRVAEQRIVCEGVREQLRVWVRIWPPPPAETPTPVRGATPTPAGPQPVPGVVLWLLWADGADRAVTGLRPQIDPGYADFHLKPGIPYALSIGEPNAPVLSGLMLPPCPDGAWGSWEVVLER
ncbi:MAG: hypothetical protein RMK65_08990 [Anaerolineae bacterium]|nr:hypothetical protein [Anaerolineae bacterium]MCX8066765.1 hypothetical protein [Anaerolineae bacterium]MDW7992243.1 hypothetical protein [Anaerolineae bacterium]